MIIRDIETELRKTALSYPVVAVVGPRQSGKTTLVRKVFNTHRYITLEDFYMADEARKDPRRFLKDFPSESGLILDEIQNVPELLSYIQGIVDQDKRKGFFVVTGSHNILVNEAITQSLAGRVAYITLFPLSIHELSVGKLLPNSIEAAVFNGSYPGVYSDGIDPEKFYKNLVASYLEKDVRQIKQIENFSLFQKFIALCAARTGQLLNLPSLANDCDIDYKTARAWISVLEATYTIFLMHPYYKNLGKRMIKSPKLYFADTGLACSLLRLRQAQDLTEHYLRGNLIENFLIADLLKQYYNLDLRPPLFFWRDQSGNELDCVIEQALRLIPLEIKAGKTPNQAFFKGLRYWKKEIDEHATGYVLYAGDEDFPSSEGRVLSWKNIGTFVATLEAK